MCMYTNLNKDNANSSTVNKQYPINKFYLFNLQLIGIQSDLEIKYRVSFVSVTLKCSKQIILLCEEENF